METTKNKKLIEAIIYIARSCLASQFFGKIKLNKILFFADANAFVRLGTSITGIAYAKEQFGPVPVGVDALIEELKVRNDVMVYPRHMPDFNIQHRVQALRDADVTVFKTQELAILNEVITWINDMTASQVSELSHTLVGWEAARMGEEIPMSTVLIPREMNPLTQAEMDRADQLAKSIAMPAHS